MTADELQAEAQRVAARMRAEDVWVSYDLRIQLVDAARFLGRVPGTLRNWKSAGTGPRAIVTKGRNTYYLVDLIAFLEVDDSLAA